MKRLELSVAADADLFDILAYGTAAYGEAISDTYYHGLTAALDFLCDYPEAGPVYESGDLGLRRWRYGQHHIFYQVLDDAIFVVRIFHVAADIVRWLDN